MVNLFKTETASFVWQISIITNNMKFTAVTKKKRE